MTVMLNRKEIKKKIKNDRMNILNRRYYDYLRIASLLHMTFKNILQRRPKEKLFGPTKSCVEKFIRSNNNNWETEITNSLIPERIFFFSFTPYQFPFHYTCRPQILSVIK